MRTYYRRKRKGTNKLPIIYRITKIGLEASQRNRTRGTPEDTRLRQRISLLGKNSTQGRTPTASPI